MNSKEKFIQALTENFKNFDWKINNGEIETKSGNFSIRIYYSRESKAEYVLVFTTQSDLCGKTLKDDDFEVPFISMLYQSIHDMINIEKENKFWVDALRIIGL